MKIGIIYLWILIIGIFQPFTCKAQKLSDKKPLDLFEAAVLSQERSTASVFAQAAETKALLTGISPPVIRMSLKEFIQQVVKKNERILAHYLNYKISQEAIAAEKSVFEPQLITSYQRGAEKIIEKTREKPLFTSGGESYIVREEDSEEENTQYQAAIETKIPTGATVKLGYTLNGSRDITLDETDQYTAYLGVELSQPLLKGGGMAATAKIDLAEMDADVSFQEYRQKMLEVVLNAAITCWDYYQAQEKLAIRKDSVKIADQILQDNKERAKLGKMAETEVLEAEAGLAKRKSLERAAKQDLVAAINNMRSYISSSAVDIDINVEFSAEIKSEEYHPDFIASMKKAFYYRPEYLSAKRKIGRENILVSYAKNQRWPQLDLIGSYGLNGLEESPKGAWHDMFDEDYKTWTVGAVMTIPLLGGLQSKSELASARNRQRQALLELKSVEVEFANMVHTSIQNVYSTLDQVHYYKNVRDLNRRLLEVEMAMLEAGRSNSRSVLDKEEDLIEAREAELESFIENRQAILILEMAEGYLLSRYGVEIMEIKEGKLFKEAKEALR